ncbi:MAG: hypothetical protein HZA17_12160 [Nitrospirae bacterium]|nr:hypothetical protein [Nitrospirota bacterium]
MKKQIYAIIILVVFAFSTSSCLALSEEQRREYGILSSAVTFSSDKVIGEYGNAIPDDFSGDKFMELVRDKIPEDYYKALKKYSVDVKPKGTYYLLLVIDPKSKSIMLFDYSCTPKADGPVLLDPEKYDVNDIDKYDECKPR